MPVYRQRGWWWKVCPCTASASCSWALGVHSPTAPQRAHAAPAAPPAAACCPSYRREKGFTDAFVLHNFL
jgi:hypothetical protein